MVVKVREGVPNFGVRIGMKSAPNSRVIDPLKYNITSFETLPMGKDSKGV
jgi:hypothetical protein